MMLLKVLVRLGSESSGKFHKTWGCKHVEVVDPVRNAYAKRLHPQSMLFLPG